MTESGRRAGSEEDPRPGAGPTEEPRPWERPGAVRRDVAPHRGNWLLLLARTALAFGALALCLAVPALVGLPVGAAVWVLGQRDLARMRAGTLDPSGRGDVQRAMDLAIVGALLSLFGLVIYACALLTLLLRR
jgi:hypothetical protein